MLARLMATAMLVASVALASWSALPLCFWCLITRLSLYLFILTSNDRLGLGTLLIGLASAMIAATQDTYPELELCPLESWAQCHTAGKPLIWGLPVSFSTLAVMGLIILVLTQILEVRQKKNAPP